MKELAAAIMLTAAIFSSAWANIYSWVDDAGVTHFTDDPDRIPARYMRRVREIPVSQPPSSSDVAGEHVVGSGKQGENDAKSEPPRLYGGLDESGWRARFSSLRTEIRTLEEKLVQKREALNQLRRKRVIYQRAQDRTSYNLLKEEIERDEARISQLQQKLSDLELEASRIGLPTDWRK